jgi:uncharacterized protein
VLSIADTGFLVAFAASRDMHHDWAVEVANELSEPALACEAVLAETAFKLRSVEVVLADLCLIRMSELYPHHRVITADKDFRVYRRNKREVIPLICPP